MCPNLDLLLGIVECSCQFGCLKLCALLNRWFRSHLDEMLSVLVICTADPRRFTETKLLQFFLRLAQVYKGKNGEG